LSVASNNGANTHARQWKRLLPRVRLSPPGLVMVFLPGILLWGGFNWSLEMTNTERFCIGCHEMRDNVYPEYRQTVHFANRTGVKATCPDCHVPRDWAHKVARKILATNELLHALRGSVDTREKFLAKRQDLAEEVWRTMRETDSRECRNCHAFQSMDSRAQRPRASQRHREGREREQTCIDCHKGIAHRLPEAFVESEHERYEREGVPCIDCHDELPEPPTEDWFEDE